MILQPPPAPPYVPSVAIVRPAVAPVVDHNHRLLPNSWSMWSLKGDPDALLNDRVFHYQSDSKQP
jgi:hypothetical protein